MALGDSLNPDCTARACRVPLLFMSIFAKRLNPAVVASVDCTSSTSEVTPTMDEHDTNMDGYVTKLLKHLPNLNETGIAPDEHVTNLVSRWSSIPRAWHYLCRKRDNVCDHRVATNKLNIKNRRIRDFGASHCYPASSPSVHGWATPAATALRSTANFSF